MLFSTFKLLVAGVGFGNKRHVFLHTIPPRGVVLPRHRPPRACWSC